MFIVDPTTKKITLHKGDTGTVVYRVSGFDLDESSRAKWTMKDSKGDVVKWGVFPFTDNQFSVVFANGDTDTLPAGKYSYDVRIAKEPVFDEEGDIIDGYIRTPESPLVVELLPVVGDI